MEKAVNTGKEEEEEDEKTSLEGGELNASRDEFSCFEQIQKPHQVSLIMNYSRVAQYSYLSFSFFKRCK